MNLRLDGQVALVTGAAGRIGAAISARLIEQGCHVHLADRDLLAAEVAADALGVHASPLHMDVTSVEDIQSGMCRIVAQHGSLDVLVNNAGVLRTEPLLESRIEDWEQVSRTNLSGVFYCSMVAIEFMSKRCHGKIVNIASISAMKGGGVFGNVLYGATKAGVIALTKGFARELGPYGINVNAIAPGVVETAMTSGQLTPAIRARLLDSLPLRRLVSDKDIANAAAFLVSDAAACITGETLVVDSGSLTL